MFRNEEKREAWLEAQKQRETVARDALIEGVNGLAARQGWVDWLGLVGRLPRYSLTNQLLLGHQLPGASMVMSAAQWRQVGRWPAKGSSALRIWAPRQARDRDVADSVATVGAAGGKDQDDSPERDAAGQRGSRGRQRFLLVPVFDVSQTAGADLPTQPTPIPPPAGQAPSGMWDAMVAYAHDAGFLVTRGDTGRADGVTNFDTHTITIAQRGSDLAQTLTLAHEIGHMSLHADPGTRDPAAEHRGRAEVQAESVAFLVASQYGLEAATEWHFDYLANWAAQVDTDAGVVVAAELRETAGGVLSAARPLLESLSEACVGHPDPLTASLAPSPPVVVEVTR